MNDSSETDHQLLRRAQQGDPLARETLLVQYRTRLRRMVELRMDRRLGSRIDASDVVQETLANACERLTDHLQTHPDRPFYPWLRQIACDRLADLSRRHIGADRRSVLREHAWSLGHSDESVSELAAKLIVPVESPHDHVVKEERLERVRQVLGELSESEREILVLRHLEQLSMAEIAEVMNLSDAAVRTRHLRALRRLRTLLGPNF